MTGNVIAQTITGDASVHALNCSIGGNVINSATTGRVNSQFINTLVKSNLEYTVITGELSLDIVNLTLGNNNPTLWANTTTGKVSVTFLQGVNLEGNLSCVIQTTTGDVSVTYTGAAGLVTGFEASAYASGLGDKTMHASAGYRYCHERVGRNELLLNRVLYHSRTGHHRHDW